MKEEFLNTNQSEPTNCNSELLLNDIPEGTIRVDDESLQLSRNQKRKRAKKRKVEVLLATISEEMKEEEFDNTLESKIEFPNKVNVFAQNQALMDQLPCIVITSQDPLVTGIQTVIDNELGYVKLSEENVQEVIKIVNDRKMKDQWNLGWGIKAEMVRKWVEVYQEA